MAWHKKSVVGVVGLGIIGERVVTKLRNSGYQVWIWNRSPKAQPHFMASVKELAKAVCHIQFFVSDGPALLSVLDELLPVLTRQHVILCHATINPQEAIEAAKKVEEKGAKFLEAPFTGSRDAAEKGELVYYVGGSMEVLEEVKQLLSVSSKKILYLGEVGQASAVKIATNLINAVSIQAVTEAFALLDRSGVPLQKLVEAMRDNSALSPTMAMKFPCILQGDFEARFSLKNMLKDIQIALAMASQYGLECPTASAFAGSAISGVQHGWGDLDYSVIARHFGYSPSAPVAEDSKGTFSSSSPATGKKARGWSFFRSKKK